MTDRELLKAALEALERDVQHIEALRFIRCHPRRHELPREWLTRCDEVIGYWDEVPAQAKRGSTIAALRAALAAPVQEPVATLYGTLPVYDTATHRDKS